MTLEQLNEQFKYDFSMKEENAEKIIPDVVTYYQGIISEKNSENVKLYNDLKDTEQYDNMYQTLSNMKYLESKIHDISLKKCNKQELLEFLEEFINIMDDSRADI